MTTVQVSLAARDELESLDPPVRDRIRDKLLDEVSDILIYARPYKAPGRHLVRSQVSSSRFSPFSTGACVAR